MTLELKPLGNGCNLSCTYCYQDPMRLAGNTRVSNKYNLDLMIDIANKSGRLKNGYSLFGGEALLVPKKDLEYILKKSYEVAGKGGVQTNGSLIDDDHIEMFKKYNVQVGISIDGPNELNEARKSANKKISTSSLTQSTMDNIVKLVENKIKVGIIITVHKLNGTGDNFNRLLDFIRWLGNIGITSGNIHMLEVDSAEAESLSLTKEENEAAFIKLAEFFDRPENQDLYYDPFKEIENMQKSKDMNAHCIWKSCDPMNTQSVYGIESNGQLSNCGMVNKEGIEWTKAEDQSFMRDLILYQTEPEFGGCKGCEYFVMCNGYCPGSSVGGDWRNKTGFCSSLKKMFKYYEEKIENQGHIPYSKRPDREDIERRYIDGLIDGQRYNVDSLDNMLEVK